MTAQQRLAAATDRLVARTDAAVAQLDEALRIARLPWRRQP